MQAIDFVTYVKTDELIFRFIHIESIMDICEIDEKTAKELDLLKEETTRINYIDGSVVYSCEPIDVIINKISAAKEELK